MGGISRAGQRAAAPTAGDRGDRGDQAGQKPGNKLITEWLLGLLNHKPRKLVAIALANKMARIAWAVMTRGETYRRQPLASAASA